MRGFSCPGNLDRRTSNNARFLDSNSLSSNSSVRGSCDFSGFILAVQSKIRKFRNFLSRVKSYLSQSVDTRFQQTQSSDCNQLQSSHDQNHRPICKTTPQDVVNYKLKLERELTDFVGVRKARELLRNRVHHWDFTILASSEDSNYAKSLGEALKRAQSGVAVAGPWEIQCGDNWMSSWERMLRRADVVVVLLSRAFFQDQLLSTSCCDLVVLRPNTRLIPVYLEELENSQYPEGLYYLSLRQGLDGTQLNAEVIAQTLIRNFSVRHFLERCIHEITALQDLIQYIVFSPDEFIV